MSAETQTLLSSTQTDRLLQLGGRSHGSLATGTRKSRSGQRPRTPQPPNLNSSRRSLSKTNSFGTGSTSNITSSISGGPRLSRRHTTEASSPALPASGGSNSRNSSIGSRKSSASRDRDHTLSPEVEPKEALRRSMSIGSNKGGRQRPSSRRRTSIGTGSEMITPTTTAAAPVTTTTTADDDLVAKSGEIWQRCQATVSSIATPSLMEKLQQDATKFRGTCPLPSIMGDSLEGSADTKGTSTEEDEGVGKSSEDSDQEEERDEEEDEEETETAPHDNHKENPAKLEEFFQFDPSKSDNLKMVRPPSEDTSIFPMQDKSDHPINNNKLEGFFQFDPSKSDHLKMVRPPSEDDSIFPMQDKSDHDALMKRARASSHHNRLEEKLLLMNDSQDELPALIDEEQTEAEDINSLFSGTWNGGFTLTTDNALGHSEELPELEPEKVSVSDSEPEPEEDDEEEDEDDEIEDDDEDEEQSLKEQNLKESQCDDASLSLERDDSSPSLEEESDDEEMNSFIVKRDSNNSQALLQFNHTTPDGLDFAACTKDDTSIFRMDSNSTMEVPTLSAAVTSELDKKLKQVTDKSSTPSGKDRRTSMFSTTRILEKARSFKKPKALIKGLMDSTDHTNANSNKNKARATSMNSEEFQALLTTSTTHSDGDNNKESGGITESDHSLEQDQQRKPTLLIDDSNTKGGTENSSNGNNTTTTTINNNNNSNSNSSSNNNGNNNTTNNNTTTANNNNISSSSNNNVDRNNPRRRRERVKGRRESAREKASDNHHHQDEDRKERLRKRDALRKAASARTLGDGLSPKKRTIGRRRSTKGGGGDMGNSSVPNLDTDHNGGGGSRRRSTKTGGDIGNSSVPNLESTTTDRIAGESGTKSPSQDGKETRRRPVRKTQSVRNLAGGERTLRRSHSSDDGTAGRHLKNASGNNGSSNNNNRRRASEQPTRHSSSRVRRDKKELDRSSGGKGDEKSGGGGGKSRRDREGGQQSTSELDRSSTRVDEKRRGKSRERRSVDRRVSRKSRRKRESTGNEDDMDRSKDSQDGSRDRRRHTSRERKHTRRPRRSKDKAADSNGVNKSNNTDLEDSPDSMEGSSNHDNEGTAKEHGASARLNKALSKMDLFEDDRKEEEEGGGGRGKVKATSSLRVERTFDGSFSELAAAHGSISETFHNDLGSGETDRRKSFIKSLSVRISAKQTTLGKGARNLIIGGSKTEKRRLLDMDDESVFS